MCGCGQVYPNPEPPYINETVLLVGVCSALHLPNLCQNSIKSDLLLAATISRLLVFKNLYGILLEIYGPHFHNSGQMQLISTNVDADTPEVANYARKLRFAKSLFS